MNKKFLYQGSVEFSGIGEITDEDVLKLIKNHSHLIDRLSQTKMVEMSLLAQCILQKVINVDPNDTSWMFYGRKSLYNMDWANF